MVDLTPTVHVVISRTTYGDGGGFQAYHFGKRISSKELEGKARTRPDILRVILGPYVQYCPCEASEQKTGTKTKILLKEIELSCCHHSICLQKTSIKKNNVKIG